MAGLQARFVQAVESCDGCQADVMLVEPNGDKHIVRCLCKRNGTTDIGEVGDGSVVGYLIERYGSQVVCALCRDVTLRGR